MTQTTHLKMLCKSYENVHYFFECFYIQPFIHRENGQCMALEHINNTISSRECLKKWEGKWEQRQSWEIIQVSESDRTFKIINGRNRGCLIIDGKVPKSARCDDNAEYTWILNQATMTTTITTTETTTTTTTTTTTSIGKFSVHIPNQYQIPPLNERAFLLY